MNDVSKWLDYWLKKLKRHVPTYVKDSQQVLDEIATLILPPIAQLFVTDADAMYNNIDTDQIGQPWFCRRLWRLFLHRSAADTAQKQNFEDISSVLC